jgi:S-formylglutathione hydrolase FrmB
MKRFTPAFLLIALVVALTYAAATPHSLAKATSQANATQATAKQAKEIDPRVRTVVFESKLVGKSLPYNVVLPVDYDYPAARDKRYPVLYLLHGLFGHYDNWTTNTKLADYASQYSMIIVMPEGGDAWYTDSATVPSDRYETYVIQELIPGVQRRYRTIEAREGRAIAGLSMGGYGALKFGVKYPEKFVFVASMSGAFGAASWTEGDLRGLEAIWRTLSPVFGQADSPTRPANDLPRLYRERTRERIATLPYVYLDCGTEDQLLPVNRSLADILLAQKIPHEYRELPGKHEWPYWDAQVQEVLKIAAQRFAKSL